MGPCESYVAQEDQVQAMHLAWGTPLYEHSLGIGASPAGKDKGLLVDEKKSHWGCKGSAGSESDQTRKQPGQEALKGHSGIVKQNHENTRRKSLTERRKLCTNLYFYRR